MTAHQVSNHACLNLLCGKKSRTGGRNHSSSHPHQQQWAREISWATSWPMWHNAVSDCRILFGKPQKNTLQLLGGPVVEAPASSYVGEALPSPSGPLAGVSPSVLSQPARPLAQEIRLAGRAVEGSFRDCCTLPCM